MITISIVTLNRREVLRRALLAIEKATTEPYRILISDNGSTDGTPEFLAQYADEHPGLVDLWLLPENVGISKARNAHWSHCVGQDTLRMDDKIEILSPHWSQIMRRQAREAQALIAFTDPSTEQLWHTAVNDAQVAYVPTWKCGAGMFIPGEVSAKLGGWDECFGLYGHEDLAYMDRAEAIGWKFGYTLCAYARHLAAAGTKGREYVQPFIPIYEERKREYADGERDLSIPIESTDGYALGAEGPLTSLVRRGSALALAFP